MTFEEANDRYLDILKRISYIENPADKDNMYKNEQTIMKTIYNNIKLGLSTFKTIVHFANAGILLIPVMVISCACAFACGMWIIGCLGLVLVLPAIHYICYSVATGIKYKLPEAGLYPFIRKKFNSNDEFMKAIEGKSHRELDMLNFMCW